MRWNDIGEMTCSVARALSVVGDRWTLLVLRDAFLGLRRFEDFQRDLGTTRHRLADRLSKLVRHGILERVRYQSRPARFERSRRSGATNPRFTSTVLPSGVRSGVMTQ